MEHRLESRLKALEENLERLDRRLERLERRLDLPTAADQPERVAPAETGRPAVQRGPSVSDISTLLGRSCLILGGAFLLRALTEGGRLTPAAGMIAGLIYGLAWLVLAARSAARGNRLSAAFLGVTSELIAFPLIWETAVRFHSLPGAAAAAVTALVASGALVVGTRAGLRVTAAGAVAGGIATGFGLMLITHAVVPFAAVLLLLGLETAFLAYVRQWHIQRWPAALAADLAVFQATLLAATPGGPPEAYAGLQPGSVVVLALTLFLGYVGLLAGRAAYRSRDLSWFETLQSALAFSIGLFGAVRVCRSTGGSCGWLAWLALGLAVAAYLIAFAHVDRREGRSRSFYFFLAEGLILFVTGTWLLAPDHLRLLLWTAGSAVAALAAARWRRVALAAESALLAGLVAVHGGGLAFALRALTATAPRAGLTVAFSALAPAGIYLLLDRFRPEGGGLIPRWPHAVTVPFAALGLLGAVVASAASLAGLHTPGGVTALATSAVSIAAVALTAGSRENRRPELALCGSLALLAAGAKLLLVDLRVGSPATLMVSLPAFGLALLATARIRRRLQGA